MSNSADHVRIVIDETSFNFNGLTPSQIDLFLSQFSDALSDLRLKGLEACKPPLFAYTQCIDEKDLYSYVLDAVDPDVMRRFFRLLDRAPEWDAGYPRCDEVEINGKARQSAWSVCFALTSVISGHGVACMAFPGFTQRGYMDINSDIGRCQVFFFAFADELPPFWRELYELENISEEEFYRLVDRAFPNLIFHPNLSFRRFEGSYLDLRQGIIQHLGALNDYFLEQYESLSAAGRIGDIESYFSLRGVGGVSRESANTRRNAKVMRLREVEFNGTHVVCEWHTKLKPNVNRIHFAFGGEFKDKILIGIFIDHLPT